MRSLATLGATCALLSSSLFAQATTLPPGFENDGRGEGTGYYSNYLGGYADQRFQILNGDLQGSNVPHTFKQMSFRRERRYGYTNYGRSWKNVTVKLADHDWTTTSTTFSTNMVGTPTEVFNGSVTWPDTTGTNTNPKWGTFKTTDDMVFTFKTPYLMSGKLGTVIDFMFTGGVLANSAAWTGWKSYYHEGIYNANSTSYNQEVTYVYGKGTCKATGQTDYAYFAPFLRSYGPGYSTAARQNMVGLHVEGVRLAMSTPCVGVFTFDGTSTGKALLNSCQNLFLDLNKPFVLIPFTSSATGGYNNSSAPWLFNYSSAAVGTRVWTQAAYDDGTPSTLQLSMAGSTWVSRQSPVSKAYRMYRYGTNVNAPTGSRYDSRVPVPLLQ